MADRYDELAELIEGEACDEEGQTEFEALEAKMHPRLDRQTAQRFRRHAGAGT